jgi:hypothetical protein
MNSPRKGTSRIAAFSSLSRTSQETSIFARALFGTYRPQVQIRLSYDSTEGPPASTENAVYAEHELTVAVVHIWAKVVRLCRAWRCDHQPELPPDCLRELEVQWVAVAYRAERKRLVVIALGSAPRLPEQRVALHFVSNLRWHMQRI